MSRSFESRDYARFDELAEEFAHRYRRGERPSLQEYVDRLPEMADEIREMFPALLEVEQAEGDARGDALPSRGKATPDLGQIGDYRIVREIGRGGMGVVYEAEQVSLGRRVALKVLPGHVVGDRKTLERFRREAKAAARLHHTNIVPVYEVGREGDVSFYAMQLIQGQGLEQVIDELARLRRPGVRPAGVRAAPDIAEPLGTAQMTPLSASARRRQRELNWMAESLLSGRLLTEDIAAFDGAAGISVDAEPTERLGAQESGPPALALGNGEHSGTAPTAGVSSSAVLPGGTHVSEVESSAGRQPFFRSVAHIGRQAAQGLAYAHARGIVHRDIKPSNLLLDSAGVVWITDFGLAKTEDDGLTATGDILGTLRYMPPERFRGEGDARADIYGLGLTLYELLALRPAYSGSDRMKLIEQVKAEDPMRPRSVDGRIPRDLETIVLKAIDKDPARRYATAEAMAEDLRRFLADEPIRARQVSTSERYWRWARRNPTIAALGAVLTTILVMVTAVSLLVARRLADLAERQGNSATAEHSARLEADQARVASEDSRAAAQAETYRALLSEAKALRAGHQLGWRDESLRNLARLAVMPTPRRDLVELRTEAVATLGGFGVKEVARFEVAVDAALALAFSPDSRVLATAKGDGHLDLWDVPGRKHLRQLVGVTKERPQYNHANGGLFQFLASGELAFITPSDHVGFLDSSFQPSDRPEITRGSARALKLRVDRQARQLAIGWDDGRIDLHDATSGALQRSFDWNNRFDFALSPDGRWLASQAYAGPVDLLPTAGDRPEFSLGHSSGYFAALAFSPDGATLASVDGRTVVLWNLASRRESLRLSGHKESVTAIAFSPDSSMVATSCGDSITRIWDARDGRPLAALPAPWYLRSLAFSPDGQYIAASAHTGQVCLYQLEGQREQRRLVGHSFGTLSVAFHPRLAEVASTSDDHNVIIWSTETARPVRQWVADQGAKGLAYSPDGCLIATGTGAYEGIRYQVRVWDAATGARRLDLAGHQYDVAALAFDRSSAQMASGDRGGTVIFWDIPGGRLLRREILGGSAVAALAFLPDGRHLLVGLEQGEIVLLDLDRSEPAARIRLPEGCTTFAIDGLRNRAILGDSQGALIALALPDLTVVQRSARAHDGQVASLGLSPDGRLLVSSGMDRRVVLRDAVAFEGLLTFPAWTGVVRDLAFDPTGRWLAFAGTDSDLCLWDVDLVHDELAALGLGWDQSVPAAGSIADLSPAAPRVSHEVPVIRRQSMDPQEIEGASALLNSGVAAYGQREFAAALSRFEQARQRFEALRESRPGDPVLVRLHALSLGFCASALRDLHRPADALPRARESLAVYELLNNPNANDLYNLACECALVSDLDARLSAAERERLQTRAVEYLRSAVTSDAAAHLPRMPADRDLDPLRGRLDFQAVLNDAAFPRNPFVQP